MRRNDAVKRNGRRSTEGRSIRVEGNTFLNMVRRAAQRKRDLRPAAERHKRQSQRPTAERPKGKNQRPTAERHKGKNQRLAEANRNAAGRRNTAEPRTEAR